MNWEVRGYERAAGRHARAGASMRERANMLGITGVRREPLEPSGQRNCQVRGSNKEEERRGKEGKTVLIGYRWKTKAVQPRSSE